MKLGICCALSSELNTLTHEKLQLGEVAHLDPDTLIILSGMGPQRAHQAAKKLIDKGATALLSWGCAAALNEQLIPGDLILPVRVITQDGGLISVNHDWHQRLSQRLSETIQLRTAPIAETNAVLSTSAKKRSLAYEQNALAADMETAAIAKVSLKHNLPWMAMRAIADSITMEIPERIISAAGATGHLPLSNILSDILIRPPVWPSVIRLARGMHSALATLQAVFTLTGSKDLR